MSDIGLHCQRQLNLFCRQYLQLLVDISYPDPACLRREIFQSLLQEKLFDERSVECQPHQRYQIRILKEVIKRIEESITDWEEEGISDGLVCRLSTLLVQPLPSEGISATQRSYVTYTLSSLSLSHANSSPPTITLLEARNLLAAAGTTGFRTWEACLHLGNYLCSSTCTIPIANKNILELGAGTGYLSVLCAKHLHAAHVLATDGAETIVEDLGTNLFLNGLQDGPVIEARELKWGHALLGGERVEWNRGRSVDVVLGADVTYDGEGIPSLVATLVDLAEISPAVKILIAATIRNEHTFESFISVCGTNSFQVEEINFPVLPPNEQEGPFYWDGIPIKLLDVKKIT